MFIDKVVPLSLTMEVGETQQATLLWSDPSCNSASGFASGNSLNWSITDESIVSVDKNGKIKALKTGSARITFYSSYPRMDTPDATITITVVKSQQPVVTEPQSSSSTVTTTAAPTETTTTTTKAPSVAELRDMAKRDYKTRTGVYPDSATATTLENGLVEIKLFDENGDLLEIYTVDPYTGVGLTNSGAGVELPQTGSNDPTDLAVALAALALMTAGGYMIFRSRRRSNEL